MILLILSMKALCIDKQLIILLLLNILAYLQTMHMHALSKTTYALCLLQKTTLVCVSYMNLEYEYWLSAKYQQWWEYTICLLSFLDICRKEKLFPFRSLVMMALLLVDFTDVKKVKNKQYDILWNHFHWKYSIKLKKYEKKLTQRFGCVGKRKSEK